MVLEEEYEGLPMRLHPQEIMNVCSRHFNRNVEAVLLREDSKPPALLT